MDFRVIKHDETKTIIEWYPDFVDKIFFGYRKHTATYIPHNGGYAVWSTDRKFTRHIEPPIEFFERIETQQKHDSNNNR